MNIKKLFATLAGVSLFAQTVVPSAGVFGATYSQELQDAYNWAYGKSITTMSPIDNANMYGAITRAELAKMLANWAKDAGKTPDTSATCTFTDTASVKGDLATAIVEACQLGLMGQGITAFRPYDTISRAEFGTALSRALWGNKYEGGNPYYANHLNALKAAGIMNQIANAESTKEVRGYVMLMLMRSEGGEGSASKADCDDEVISLACQLGTDACPAECKEDAKDEDEVVKSGDLAVKATPSTNRKAVATGISDLDTITLKASEAITLNSVTLERYGYSDGAKVVNVWLEDEDGTIITSKKGLNKDKVTLTLKKDYKELESTDTFTIVVELAGADGDIGFKVVDVDASAKNLDLSDYDPYTYQIVVYDGATITLTQKGKANIYNYEEGKSYEVQRFKTKAETTAITVNGFTLKSDNTITTVDLQDGVKDVEVTVNGEAVDGLKWDINSKKELKVNFDEVEIATRESATFAVNLVFVDGFEDLGGRIKLDLAKTDFNAVEKKTGSRVTVENALVGYIYTIDGGKITLTNNKLGNVEAAPETDDVVFGEGKISVAGQNLVLNGFTLTFTTVNHSDKAITDDVVTANKALYPAVSDVRMVVGGDETTATCVSTNTSATVTWAADTPSGYTANYTTTCTFPTVDVDKDSNIKFLANLTKYAKGNTTITLSAGSYGKALITNAGSVGTYDDANKPILASNFIGTIDLNQIKVQTPRGSLESSDVKTAQFVKGKSDTLTIFKGTYLAKNKDINLNSFSAESTTDVTAQLAKFDELTLKVFVNGNEVATPDLVVKGTKLVADDDFSNVLIKKGEKADVEVKVQAYPNNVTTASIELNVTFSGEDADGNPAGEATEVAAQFKAVEKGSVSVSDDAYSSSKEFQNNSVSLKKSGATLAKFDLKASNSDANVDLENFCFSVTRDTTPITSTNEIRVKVAGKTVDDLAYGTCPDGVTAGFVATNLNEPLESNGVAVEISTKGNPQGSAYVVTLVNVNSDTKNVNKIYKQYILPVKVAFSQQDLHGTTKFTASMEKGDNEVEITSIELLDSNGVSFAAPITITSISEGSNGTVEAAGIAGVQLIGGVSIQTDETTVTTPETLGVYTITLHAGDTAGKKFTIDGETVTLSTAATATATDITSNATLDGKYSVTAAGMVYTLTQKVGSATAPVVANTDVETAPVLGTTTAGVAEVTAAKAPYVISKSVYNDYFKVGDTYLKVFDKDSK